MEVSNLFSEYLRISLLLAIIIILLIAITPILNRRYSIRWRYWTWAVIAVQLIIPLYFIGILLSPHITSPVSQLAASLSETIALPISASVLTASDNLVGAAPSVKFLSILWVSGIILYSLYLLGSYILFRINVNRWLQIPFNKQINVLSDQIQYELGIEKKIALYKCRKVSGPMIFGIRKPTILIPHEDYSPEDLRIILEHEIRHYLRHDILYKCLMMAACIVHWYNPIVHLMACKAGKDLEICCDSDAMKGRDFQFRSRHSDVIMSSLQSDVKSKVIFSTYFSQNKRNINQRFTNIFDMKPKKKGGLIFGIILVATLIVTTAGIC